MINQELKDRQAKLKAKVDERLGFAQSEVIEEIKKNEDVNFEEDAIDIKYRNSKIQKQMSLQKLISIK